MSGKCMIEEEVTNELKIEHLYQVASKLSSLEENELELIKDIVMIVINKAIKISNNNKQLPLK